MTPTFFIMHWAGQANYTAGPDDSQIELSVNNCSRVENGVTMQGSVTAQGK